MSKAPAPSVGSGRTEFSVLRLGTSRKLRCGISGLPPLSLDITTAIVEPPRAHHRFDLRQPWICYGVGENSAIKRTMELSPIGSLHEGLDARSYDSLRAWISTPQRIVLRHRPQGTSLNLSSIAGNLRGKRIPRICQPYHFGNRTSELRRTGHVQPRKPHCGAKRPLISFFVPHNPRDRGCAHVSWTRVLLTVAISSKLQESIVWCREGKK
jgi:hypothetical protein